MKFPHNSAVHLPYQWLLFKSLIYYLHILILSLHRSQQKRKNSTSTLSWKVLYTLVKSKSQAEHALHLKMSDLHMYIFRYLLKNKKTNQIKSFPSVNNFVTLICLQPAQFGTTIHISKKKKKALIGQLIHQRGDLLMAIYRAVQTDQHKAQEKGSK